MVRLGWIYSSLVIFVLVQCGSSKKLPPYVYTCSRDDPDLNNCLVKAVDVIRPYLKNGITEMRIPPLDPFRIESVALDTGESFQAEFRDMLIYGATNFKVKNINFNFDQNMVDLTVSFPHLRIKSVYAVKGRILILQLNGHGNADGNYTNLEVQAVVTGKRNLKRGREHISFDNVNLDIKLGKTNLFFEDLFPGNPEITEQTNRIISNNINEVFYELKPVLDQTIGKFILQLIHDVFEKYSLDELFPPRRKQR